MVFSQDWSDQRVGDYRLLRRLGDGSFGDVYLAEDLHEHSQVAIKIMKPSVSGREGLNAFFNEVRSMRLRHPHILPLLDFGLSEQDLPFLVMEYVDGGTLRERYPKGCNVPLDAVVDLTMQLASALQYAHDHHVVHRDVKPENMLCRMDDTVLLSDFGIASVARASSSVSASPSFGGTPSYMAPEQHDGKPQRASDQYALAVVVYEWLAGARPFRGTLVELVSQHLYVSPPSLRDQVPMLPAAVEEVVFKALSKDPQERFPSVHDFAIALRTASLQREVSVLTTPVLSQYPVSPEAPQPVPDQATQSDGEGISRRGAGDHKGSAVRRSPSSSSCQETRAGTVGVGLAPYDNQIPTLEGPTVPVAPPPLTRVDQPRSMGTPAIIPSVSRMAALAEVPTSRVVPVSHPTQHKGVSNRCLLFTLLFVLLVALSGGGLYYFGFIVQRTPALSPAQATATAAAQAYAEGTANQGVMFGFDASHARNNPYEHTLSPANVSHLKPQWSFLTAGSISSSPAIAGDIVYVSSTDRRLYAFDARCRSDCQPLWSFATEDVIYSSPAVVGGVVYVGSFDKKLYAFDARCRSTCQPLWSYATGDKIYSSPVVAGGMVYVGSFDKKLYAFDARCRSDCQPLWSFATKDKIDSSPAVAGGMVYIGSQDDKLYAFDASCRSDCQPLWSSATGGPIESSPAVANGMVYVGSDDHKFYAFDAVCRNACRPLWSFLTGGVIWSSPAVVGDMVYVGSQDDQFYAFDVKCRNTCQSLWSFLTGGSISSEPVVAGGMVYIGSDDDKLYAFDATCRNTCQPLWSYATGDKIESSPVVANGVVYVGSLDGKLYAFGLAL